MKHKTKFLLLPLLAVIVISTACVKEEGVGGNCTLTGKVYAKDYNGSGVLVSEYYAADERVFIVYGKDAVYSDEFRTSYDGTYQFENLFPGTYTLFVYSKCDSCDAPESAVMDTIEFTGNKEKIVVDDLVIRK
jgi:hypothetical protein